MLKKYTLMKSHVGDFERNFVFAPKSSTLFLKVPKEMKVLIEN